MADGNYSQVLRKVMDEKNLRKFEKSLKKDPPSVDRRQTK